MTICHYIIDKIILSGVFLCYMAFFVLNVSHQHIFCLQVFVLCTTIYQYIAIIAFLRWPKGLRWNSIWSCFSVKLSFTTWDLLRKKVNVFKFFTFKIRSKCALFFTDKCYTIRQSVPCRPPKLSSSCVHAVDVLHSLAKCFYTHGSKDFLICGVRQGVLSKNVYFSILFNSDS